MKLQELITALERLAPLPLQEAYDNAGLALGDPDMEIDSCMVCLDVTEDSVDEAISGRIPLIISHHPLIFTGLKKITPHDPVGRLVLKAIKHNIALYAMHTNLDNVSGGVNKVLSDKLGLESPRILKPMKGKLVKLVTFCPLSHAEQVRQAIFHAGAGVIGNYDCCSYNLTGQGTFRANESANPFVGEKGKIHVEEEARIETILPAYLESSVVRAMVEAHPYEEVAYDIYPLANEHPGTGAGMIGVSKEAMDEVNFLEHVKRMLGVPVVRHSRLEGRTISQVALCGGSGSFLLEAAISSGADAFVTADVKYHLFQEAEGRILLVDAGHFETEQFTVELIARYLMNIFPTFAVHISEMSKNPVNYL